MPEPPRRKRFQIHLSTAIVLMVVAGGLIWANFSGRVEINGTAYPILAWPIDPQGRDLSMGQKMTESEFLASKKNKAWEGERIVEYGWPFTAATVRSRKVIFSADLQQSSDKFSPRIQPIHTLRRWRWIILNALTAFGILFAVWFLCERLLRRSAAKEP